MSVGLKTMSTKIINGVYCCVIHEMYFWFFMHSDYSCQQRDKFIHEKIQQSFCIFWEAFLLLCRLKYICKNTCAFSFL